MKFAEGVTPVKWMTEAEAEVEERCEWEEQHLAVCRCGRRFVSIEGLVQACDRCIESGAYMDAEEQQKPKVAA